MHGSSKQNPPITDLIWGQNPKRQLATERMQICGTYLRGHATPEVGVECPGVQHGGHQRTIFGNQLFQNLWIRQQVITVCKLKRRDLRDIRIGLGPRSSLKID